MGTVTVDGNTITIYGDLAGAKAYCAGIIGPSGDAWRALLDNEKSRSLVSARYYLDRQAWQGSRTDPAQALDWPREDVVYADSTPVPSDSVPVEVIDAEYELAVMLVADASTYTAADSGTNTKMLKAGPLEIEYFKPTTGRATKLPQVIMDLVGEFLASAVAVTGGIVSGNTDDDGDPITSSFDDADEYTRNSAF